ncbi:unnamed protein product [Nippostrongylus brasiliensis]|uniref:Reverse transcriptase domain-containing protein n=1 Tax=Nippostrongylus brasiliensis TaxID=27835 RepID=A0A0N4YK05_NIPBR|nr:unnamed protein product [Nippostrongylus brasiliensis]
MTKDKSPGTDGITVEMLLACGQKLFSALTQRFTQYVTMCEIPAAWKRSKTILLFKKGDKEDLANHGPITLLPVLYEVFTRCPLTRMKRTSDDEQPIQQAGSRRKFGTLLGSIDGGKLNHLRFANVIVLITWSTDHASSMLEELHNKGANFGLTVKMSKTKFMKDELADENSVRVQVDPLEEVTEYVYLGRLLNMKNDLKPEILRKKKAG